MASKTEFIVQYGYIPKRGQQSLFEMPVRKEFVLERIGSGKEVLDVGCCTGMIGELMIKQGNRVTGVELNPQHAAEARTRGLEVMEQDLESEWPFADASFDVIHAGEIVEHIFDTEHLFREMHRVLRDDGHLFFTTPNLNSFDNRFLVLFGKPLPYYGAYARDRHGTHVRVFNLEKVKELLELTGFRLVETAAIPNLRVEKIPILNKSVRLAEIIVFHAVKA